MKPNCKTDCIAGGRPRSGSTIKIRRAAQLLSGDDMIHLFKKFKKHQFKTSDPGTILYCGDYTNHIGEKN